MAKARKERDAAQSRVKQIKDKLAAISLQQPFCIACRPIWNHADKLFSRCPHKVAPGEVLCAIHQRKPGRKGKKWGTEAELRERGLVEGFWFGDEGFSRGSEIGFKFKRGWRSESEAEAEKERRAKARLPHILEGGEEYW
jgi:hypothetical protein